MSELGLLVDNEEDIQKLTESTLMVSRSTLNLYDDRKEVDVVKRRSRNGQSIVEYLLNPGRIALRDYCPANNSGSPCLIMFLR